MDAFTVLAWYQIVGAVIGGNLLSFGFAYFVWRMDKREKAGEDPLHLPFLVCVGGALAPITVAIAAYTLI